MVKSLSSKAEFDTVCAGELPVIVDFTASWCGPCQFIGPEFVKFAEEFAGKAEFVKVDVDECADVAEACGISAMPTFKVFKGGKEVDELVGASKDKLKALIEKNI